MSKNKGLGAALTKSLKNEKASIDQRFAAAEKIIGNTKETAPKAAAVKAVETPVEEKTEKATPQTFSLPERDITLIGNLRKRSATLVDDEIPNKSEIVRAALALLDNATDVQFEKALNSIERLKVGKK